MFLALLVVHEIRFLWLNSLLEGVVSWSFGSALHSISGEAMGAGKFEILPEQACLSRNGCFFRISESMSISFSRGYTSAYCSAMPSIVEFMWSRITIRSHSTARIISEFIKEMYCRNIVTETRFIVLSMVVVIVKG